MITYEEQIKLGFNVQITEQQIWGANKKLSDGEMQFFHFFYPIKDLREELTLRTSYHGKFTQTLENVAQSVDRMSLTEDDDKMFMLLLKKAASDVFDNLQAFAKYEKSFFFDQSKLEIDLANLPSPAIPIYKYQIVEVTSGEDKKLMICSSDTDSDYPFETEITDPTKPNKYWELGVDYSNTVHFIFMITPTVYKSMISVIDEAIRNSLVSHVLWNWYKGPDPNQSIEEKQTYEDEIATARGRLNSGFRLKTNPRFY